ncbi:hypothetical protein [Agaribacter flavus]|uniref:Nudix hydrolase domain-containing protein n=1 Tax=Agaribacter flavus TaxID=1902781 RepID=A0ABV7FN87_9ALTE
MTDKTRTVLLCLLTTLLVSCTQREFSAPSCRVDVSHHSSLKSPAACLISKNGRILALVHDDKSYSIPARTNKPSESGQCAAHRAVWEDTGLNVKVSAPLGTLPDNTWLYACFMQSGFDGSEETLTLPDWANADLAYMTFVDPFDLDVKQWSKPEQLINIRDGLITSQSIAFDDKQP